MAAAQQTMQALEQQNAEDAAAPTDTLLADVAATS